ncbi:hypothetical protein M431DRAFT_207256 [Trichoderma harzianum CBS 226.95]|uniref:Uncharacterized protein n=1 Tax=Trichoderma harzianum CBS 226.95 TaxID=983964 RepID=A0A2T4AW40_TRIHA|nr:hypothetical protein M431DRAFT_207256 [Trichoderma harzianum CBS 226.95]PTB61261.1 hypothetical protein M431DRAFT_207256 [Trichoderma harzianum CBS 226.95]
MALPVSSLSVGRGLSRLPTPLAAARIVLHAVSFIGRQVVSLESSHEAVHTISACLRRPCHHDHHHELLKIGARRNAEGPSNLRNRNNDERQRCVSALAGTKLVPLDGDKANEVRN